MNGAKLQTSHSGGDDANAIKNVFEHEKNHYENFKKMGYDAFSKASEGFQKSQIQYGRKHGLIIDVNAKTSGIQLPKIKPIKL